MFTHKLYSINFTEKRSCTCINLHIIPCLCLYISGIYAYVEVLSVSMYLCVEYCIFIHNIVVVLSDCVIKDQGDLRARR